MDEENELENALGKLLMQMGAEAEQASTMASQLVKRARQIAAEQDVTEAEALAGLLKKIHDARKG